MSADFHQGRPVTQPKYWSIASPVTSSLSDLGLIFCRQSILPRIELQISPTNIAAIARGGSGEILDTPAAVRAQRWESAQPRLSAYILLMFQAMVTRLHSPRTRSSPRSRNWRNPITDLMIPNTGSGVCLRKP